MNAKPVGRKGNSFAFRVVMRIFTSIFIINLPVIASRKLVLLMPYTAIIVKMKIG